VFRREALFHQGRPITDWIGRTLNEIPMQILLAFKGGIRVIPEIGLYKSAPRTVCEQARWEQVGGPLPNWRGWMSYLNDCRSNHRYHKMVMHENFAAIDALGCDGHVTRDLRKWTARCLSRHELLLAMRWKPKVSVQPQAIAMTVEPTVAEGR
jgi:hypothetical protein